MADSEQATNRRPHLGCGSVVVARPGFSDATPSGSTTLPPPGLRRAGALGLAIEGAVQIPAAQSLFGIQTDHATARLTLSLAR